MSETTDSVEIFLRGLRDIQFFMEIGMTYLDPNDFNPASRSVWGAPQIIETPYGNRVGGLRGDVPDDYAQECLDIAKQEQQRQKASSSVSSLDASGVTILIDPASGDMTLQQGHNHIVIKNGDLPALAGDCMRATPQSPAPASVTAPTPAAVQPPKFQGNDYSRQARLNEENMKRALRPEAQADMRKNWRDQPLPTR